MPMRMQFQSACVDLNQEQPAQGSDVGVLVAAPPAGR